MKIWIKILIGVSLSGPHTSEIALCIYVCIFVCLVALLSISNEYIHLNALILKFIVCGASMIHAILVKMKVKASARQ